MPAPAAGTRLPWSEYREWRASAARSRRPSAFTRAKMVVARASGTSSVMSSTPITRLPAYRESFSISTATRAISAPSASMRRSSAPGSMRNPALADQGIGLGARVLHGILMQFDDVGDGGVELAHAVLLAFVVALEIVTDGLEDQGDAGGGVFEVGDERSCVAGTGGRVAFGLVVGGSGGACREGARVRR